jgi:tetratricopeptide (TPR) repeat protein
MTADAPLDALLRQGLTHHRAARLGEAARCYRALIAVAPDHADGLHLLGLVEHASGDHRAAVAHLRRAVRLRPAVGNFRANLGTVCLAAGDFSGAESSFRAALEREPENAGAWANLGLALLNAGRPAEAEGALRAAIALAPRAADTHGNLGACLHRLERFAEAAEALRAALAIDANLAPARACLGLVLQALGAPTEAEACLRATLAGQPESAAAHTNLGNLLRAGGRLEEAEEKLRRAAALRPDDPDTWHNLAAVLATLGRLAAAEAERCCRRALALDPAHADAHYTLGTVQLLGGRMPEGFFGLEWRWRRRGFAAPRSLAAPRWDGTPLAGRTLLLHGEQGFGDSIQMLRFVLALAEQGTVVLEVPATLRRLAEGLGARVIVAGDPLPPVDVECPLPSLPHALALTFARVPKEVPYLHPDPALAVAWAARLAALPGRRVGLVWAGNSAHAADARRSIPPALLTPLGEVAGISFVSLQPGAAPPPGVAMQDWTGELRSFADTAALVAGLDLVIAVDTAVAHLAGALGRPVWLLNRFDTDWRWLREGDTCPWYPTLRQIRQPAPGDWRAVIAAATAHLARCVSGEAFIPDGPPG